MQGHIVLCCGDGGWVLCTLVCLTISLASTHSMPPGCDNQKCLQTLPKAAGGGNRQRLRSPGVRQCLPESSFGVGGGGQYHLSENGYHFLNASRYWVFYI